MLMTFATEDYLKKVLQKVEEASSILLTWLPDNYTVANADKCHLLTSTSEEVVVKKEN